MIGESQPFVVNSGGNELVSLWWQALDDQSDLISILHSHPPATTQKVEETCTASPRMPPRTQGVHVNSLPMTRRHSPRHSEKRPTKMHAQCVD